MNDAGYWAKAWLAGLMRDAAPRPLTLHDQHCAGVAQSELHERLRELRSPVADGVPKHGRYAVVYEQPWGGQEAVWMEAAEYIYGMFGARFVFVQLVRRSAGGELVALGTPVELADGRLAELPAREVASVREVVDSGLARVRRAWAERPRVDHPRASGSSVGSSLGSTVGSLGSAVGSLGSTVGTVADVVSRAVAVAPLWWRRIAGRPAAVVGAVWTVLVLLGVISAFALTGGQEATVKPGHTSRNAARVVAAPAPSMLAPALSAAAPAAKKASAPAAKPPAPAPAEPVRGDLGLPVPMSRPSCDGAYGVIVASVTRPDAYEHDVRDLLARYSGSSYLLAEQTCPSLRARTSTGDSIYAVYYGPYDSLGNACATRARIGAGSYVRKLDDTDSHGRLIHC
jgi:serine/threonine-protein kinase